MMMELNNKNNFHSALILILAEKFPHLNLKI